MTAPSTNTVEVRQRTDMKWSVVTVVIGQSADTTEVVDLGAVAEGKEDDRLALRRPIDRFRASTTKRPRARSVRKSEMIVDAVKRPKGEND
jgi:hypothetical protein